MRLTSDFFVAATLRRVAAEGAFATLRRRGEEQAGAIYVLVDRLDGTGTLYGPAPQASYEDKPSERFFTRLHKEESVSLALIEARLEKEFRFDPDCFVIEIEDRQGRSFVETLS
jgi:hypothetical protein